MQWSRARIIIISAASGFVLLAAGTAAGAAIAGPVDGQGVIHGCYDSGGNLKVIDSTTSCPKFYTQLNWNQQGPQGQQGQPGAPGAPGAQGPPGPPGPSSLDALNGTVCNGNSPDAGVLKVSYTSGSDAVSFSCVPTTLETLNVTVTGGRFPDDSVTSDVGGISCTKAGEATCSTQMPRDYNVTLTEHPVGDRFTGWSGGGCSGTGTTCTVKMSDTENVTANFVKLDEVTFFWSVPTQDFTNPVLTLSTFPDGPDGSFVSSNEMIVAIADGSQVSVTANDNTGTAIIWGGNCAGTSGNTCTFTLNGDGLVEVAISPT